MHIQEYWLSEVLGFSSYWLFWISLKSLVLLIFKKFITRVRKIVHQSLTKHTLTYDQSTALVVASPLSLNEREDLSSGTEFKPCPLDKEEHKCFSKFGDQNPVLSSASF